MVDDIKTAGTFDRLIELDGQTYIADIKTGTIVWSLQKIAMQLAIYSRGQRYDPATGNRTPLGNVNQRNGIIIHLPAEEASCTLYWVNIDAGWQAVERALWVRNWRNTKGLTQQMRTP